MTGEELPLTADNVRKVKRLAAIAVAASVLFGCSQYSTTAPVPAGRVLLVANSTANSVIVFNVVGGTATAVQTIVGPDTGLNFPTGVGFSAGLIFVANNHGDTVTVYAKNANGDAAPVTTISGVNPGLDHPTDIDVDSTGRVYVGNSAGNSVRVFAPNETGNAVPLASIVGPDTALDHPVALHHDGAGNVYVVNTANSSVTIYHSADIFSSVSGDVIPFATLSGAMTGLVNPSGIVLDSAGNVYVTNDFPDSITVYAPNPTGDQAPTATIAGPATTLNGAGDIDIVGSDLVVANTGANDLLAFPFSANGNVAPAYTVSGSGLMFPNGLGTE